MRFTCFALALAFAVCGPSHAQAKRDLSVWASPHSEQSIRQIPEWKKIAFDAGQAWIALDIAALEDLLSRDPALLASDGSSLQDLAFRSVENFVYGTEVIHPSQSKYEPILADWRRRYPYSAAPDIINAMLLFRYTNRLLDGGNGGQNVWFGFNPMDSGLAETKSALERSEDYAKAYPFWYTLMIRIEAARKAKFDDLFVLADAARLASQSYIDPPAVLVEHLLTNAGWSRAGIESTVRSLSMNSDARIDPTRYARIYRAAFASVYHYRLFESSDANWPIVREGLRTLAVISSTDTTTSQHAALACLAGDRDEAAAAFEKLTGKIVEPVWVLPKFYEDCLAWSQGRDRK